MSDDHGLFTVLFHRNMRCLSGVHVIGSGVHERVRMGQVVLRLEGVLGYFMSTVFHYTAMAGCDKVASLEGV